ncbi:uncharacterized protein B0I36DRAFT_39904 [Microdochium trichocladiopsis]|uniref:Uncharacterized protein n=1 Tax=Microdochium trichocladiopsis TaxID=1682393 RepID=A0A9P9BJU3_9PEZI|nr:uncharacterized protein B0I36DRAFT_39904 [Microdochium trichocladiopsis]KAH7018498.1 hypothetical protein B0I36DRAFT_39904 [Microdochium trichocladiopsis]
MGAFSRACGEVPTQGPRLARTIQFPSLSTVTQLHQQPARQPFNHKICMCQVRGCSPRATLPCTQGHDSLLRPPFPGALVHLMKLPQFRLSPTSLFAVSPRVQTPLETRIASHRFINRLVSFSQPWRLAAVVRQLVLQLVPKAGMVQVPRGEGETLAGLVSGNLPSTILQRAVPSCAHDAAKTRLGPGSLEL